MSDLHIDINQFDTLEVNTLLQVLKEEKIDQLHIAGDIANDYHEVAEPFLNQLSQHITVTHTLGNHDMLKMTETEIRDRDFQVYQVGQKQLLAFNGWYDYTLGQEDDIDKILKTKKTFWFDRRLNRPLSDIEETQRSLALLDQHLKELDKDNLIVAMHFVPHPAFTMTHERFLPFNAFLGSKHFHEVFQKYGVQDVVFGHAHRSYGHQTIDNVTYHPAPLGYKREWELTIDFVSNHPEYNPTGTWNLSKRYNLVKHKADFQTYYRQQLKNEFKHSMTVFDC